MTTDPETLRFYAKAAEGYNKVMGAQSLPALWQNLAARLEPGDAVLDFGCGGGWAARAFHGKGFEVTALDPSAEMLALLDGSGIQTICGDVSALPEAARFHAIWSFFALQHIAREEMPDVLARLCRAVQPGGYLAIGIHEGDETLRDSLDRLYCHWPEATLRQLLGDQGLTVISTTQNPDKGFDGRPFTALHLLAHRPVIDTTPAA